MYVGYLPNGAGVGRTSFFNMNVVMGLANDSREKIRFILIKKNPLPVPFSHVTTPCKSV